MIYLDNAATSFPKPEQVYRGMEAFVRAAGANPGRGGHRRALEAESLIGETRRLLARLFHAPAKVAAQIEAPGAAIQFNVAGHGHVAFLPMSQIEARTH